MNKVKPIDFSITSISTSGEAFRTEDIFLTHEFGILFDMSHIMQEILKTNRSIEFPGSFFVKFNQPYRLREGRVALVLQGEITVCYNLIEYTIRPSQLLIAPVGSIIEIKNVHPDTVARMMGFSPSFISIERRDEHAEYYFRSKQQFIIPLSESAKEIANGYYKLIWHIVQAEKFHRDSVQHLVVSFLHFINRMREEFQFENNTPITHRKELFNRFIALVNKYSIHERNVGFYADKLCLTPRYLNTTIRQISGQTVMDWVNQAIIIEAKVMLKHESLLIYQVADKLNFSNPSFFCKFFKRITGQTPQEYQES